MKRLIICVDGTWNHPAQEDGGVAAPTNVYKLFNAIPDRSENVWQMKYYHPGIGSEGKNDEGGERSLLSKVQGALGIGMCEQICSAYHWLGLHYEPGDEVYLYGFSRGAYTVRSLSGFLSKGLLCLKGIESADSWQRVHQAFEVVYKKENSASGDVHDSIQSFKPDWSIFHEGAAVPIRFLGVWDTVGALGIPDDLGLLNRFDHPEKWRFHNTELGSYVQAARHAMAMDEMRSSFTVTKWCNLSTHPNVKQIWFAGAHADVGGGHADCGLSNHALSWMLEESQAEGLGIREGVLELLQQQAHACDTLHCSYKGLFAKFPSRPRNIDAFTAENKALFHHSAVERQHKSPIQYAPYGRTTQLSVGESLTVDIFADTRWNATTVFLEKGQAYIFTAEGTWLDGRDVCDWEGTEDGQFTIGDLARGFGDYLLPRRVKSIGWFALVGAVTNDGIEAVFDEQGNELAKTNGTPFDHQYIQLSQYSDERKPFTVEASGYLYGFPNDAWKCYKNNRGSIQLTIKRIK